MAQSLARKRCFNHARREAAARCPECGRYYCRECVTEHEDRVVCADCLELLAGAPKRRGSRLALLKMPVLFAAGFLALWIFFFALGRGLLALPSSFHQNTLWKVDQRAPK
jgi:hypothetical protein